MLPQTSCSGEAVMEPLYSLGGASEAALDLKDRGQTRTCRAWVCAGTDWEVRRSMAWRECTSRLWRPCVSCTSNLALSGTQPGLHCEHADSAPSWPNMHTKEARQQRCIVCLGCSAPLLAASC